MADKFEQWGVVELMGRQQAAGRLSEENIGGASMLRVDMPVGDTFRTAYYGPSAIYAVHVTGETEARAAAATMGKRPPYAYVIDAGLRQLASPSVDDESEHDGDQEDDDDIEF